MSPSPQAQIITRLRQGTTASDLIKEGFRPSTVYHTRTIFLGVQAATQHNRTHPTIIAEIRLLRSPPSSLSLHQIASQVGVSVRTVHNAVRDLPVPTLPPTRGTFWTPEQDAYLASHYPQDDREALIQALQHPWNSIANRASRLGLHRPRRPAASRALHAKLPAPAITLAPPLPPPTPRPSTPVALLPSLPFHAVFCPSDDNDVSAFIATRGVTVCPPVGDPALLALPPMRWDPKSRKGTRRPLT